MVFLTEAAVFCFLFHILIVHLVTKDPVSWIDDYPPAIAKRARELGLVKEDRDLGAKKLIIGKAKKTVLLSLILTFTVIFINHAGTFKEAFLISYGLWAVVAWYDALILDCIWFCHSKKCIIPGTEDMTKDYHDYKFHIKMSCLGMVLGLPAALLTGIFTEIASHFIYK